MANWRTRWKGARATQGSSLQPAPRDWIVRHRRSRRDFFQKLRCDDFFLAVLDYGDGRLPPHSFLRDKLSSHSGSWRNRRCGGTRPCLGTISVFQNCPEVHRGTRTPPGTGTRFLLESVAVFAWCPLESAFLGAEASAPALHTSLLLGVVVLVLALIYCWNF